MSMMKQVLAAAFLSITLQGVVLAQELSAEKKALIDRLLEQTGQTGRAVAQQFAGVFVETLTASMKQSHPDVSPRAYDILGEEIVLVLNEALVNEQALAELLYPVYDRYLSEDDLIAMIAFNDTDVGRKLIAVTPALTQDAMLRSQGLMTELVPVMRKRVVARLKEEGIDPGFAE